MAYTFSSLTASNGITLKVIKTTPGNIKPVGITPLAPVTSGSVYGVNAGFANNSNYNECFSIGVYNDVPVKGAKGVHNTGWFNEYYTRGTLVYDAYINSLSVKVIDNASQSGYVRPDMYWAIGGISLGLQNTNWSSQMTTEHVEGIGGVSSSAARTAIVYDSSNNIHLVITESKTSITAFRAAILNKIPNVRDGVLLDGGGSTEMLCKEYTFTGTDPNRKLGFMVGIINK
ncbi:exopolysaccharide biosynthesis protein [Paenibacillus sp. PastF-3]|uniref:phosphodiester glycosidase family protein n=1 Tax=unclassified Paenibacillus TaxID=185978 RepID=UPI0024765C65|nr:phosphodiester glycosidase family protein [Paenibacillus sp. PastF-3]MDH6374297.1 exopolysaccharide biosynthesis protein [Paenibacillus sp. PastF-3]